MVPGPVSLREKGVDLNVEVKDGENTYYPSPFVRREWI